MVDLNDFLLIFLKKVSDLKENPIKIPSERFWAFLILFINMGVEIKIKGHILTIEDCFIEMEDCALGDTTGKTRLILLWLKQNKTYFGWNIDF